MEKMNITKALAEIKLLDKRIEKEISNASFVTYAKNSATKVKNGTLTKEEFSKKAKASYQSITDMIARRNKIKSAIAVSNATNIVKVADKEYSVTEAITRKNTIESEKELIQQMKWQYNNSNGSRISENEVVNKNLQNLLVAMVGKDNAKNMSDEASKISTQYLSEHEFDIVDPVGVLELVESLEKEIDEFLADVDYALSYNNAITEIEID